MAQAIIVNLIGSFRVEIWSGPAQATTIVRKKGESWRAFLERARPYLDYWNVRNIDEVYGAVEGEIEREAEAFEQRVAELYG